MSSPPRHLPRFLPTLTEVVRPSELSMDGQPSRPDPTALTQTLMMQVDALVQARVQQDLEKLIRSVVVERSNAWVAELQVELRREVRKLVAEAIGDRHEGNKFNS